MYGALELPFEDSSVGAVSEEVPGVGLDEVEEAVVSAYDRAYGLSLTDLPVDLVEEARALLPDHVV